MVRIKSADISKNIFQDMYWRIRWFAITVQLVSQNVMLEGALYSNIF